LAHAEGTPLSRVVAPASRASPSAGPPTCRAATRPRITRPPGPSACGPPGRQAARPRCCCLLGRDGLLRLPVHAAV